MSQSKVLVSACLLGAAVRYDGSHKRVHDPILQIWFDAGRIISVCPELAGGLTVPRAAAEIESGANAVAILHNKARVLTKQGEDVSSAFAQGAQHAAELVRLYGIRVAVLKDGSPSCGSSQVYDGSFSGKRIAGQGLTVALLRQMGVRVFSELELAQADEYLKAQ
jgi:uncharacterized protein YbbK (DUF523 family)